MMKRLATAITIAILSFGAHAADPGEGKAFTPNCRDGKLIGAYVAAISQGAPFVAFYVEFNGEEICKGEPDTHAPVGAKPAAPTLEPEVAQKQKPKDGK